MTLWIQDQNRRQMPLSLALIQAKALSPFNTLKEHQNEEASSKEVVFSASRGWFEQFKARYALHNVRIQGEAASADDAAAEAFPGKLAEIIAKGGYTNKQVFNIDETGLFWKIMPSRTYLAKEEKSMPGFKASKDRLTLLLGANASGDFKLKPLLIYHFENPRAMKGHDQNHLPVI